MSLQEIIGYLLAHRRIASSSSSSSSSSSEEEWAECIAAIAALQNDKRGKKRKKQKPKPSKSFIINSEEIINGYSDEEFKKHFKLSKHTFNYLHELIKENLVRSTTGFPTIHSRHQLIIALWKMGTTDSYKSVCEKFNVGRATAVRAVRRVCHALFIRASLFIQWPSGDRAINVMHEFEKASGFPKTIGAIDETTIRIHAPTINAADYVNREGYNSVQLQLVCDHKQLITNYYIEPPTSVKDQRIFHLTDVAKFLNNDDAFPENSHIVGDAAYEIHPHLLTPYQDNGDLSEKQKSYNSRHSAARVTIERCISLLRGRTRSLFYLSMNRIDLMSEYIVACCVLHNICILHDDDERVVNVPMGNQEYNKNYSCELKHDTGILKRDAIMNSF